MKKEEMNKRGFSFRPAYVPGQGFYARDAEDYKNTFRMNYSKPSKKQIDRGIEILGEIFKQELK